MREDRRPWSSRSWASGDIVLRGSQVGDGPLVLLLHAGRERRDVWYPVMDDLVAHHRVTCLAVDQRGHGESSGTPRDLASYGDDVATMLRGQAGPCVVVGCSLGGMAAMASLDRSEVRDSMVGLILVDVVPDPDPQVAREFLGGRGLLEGGNPLVEDILAAGPVLRSRLAAAGLPVLLVRGGRSPICDDAAVSRLRAEVPSLLVQEVADAGHLVAHDQPAALARAMGPTIEAWLESA